MEVLTNLRSIRLDANMTQEELAQRLGIAREAIAKWETGRNYPRMDLAIQTACILGCGLDDLFPLARQYRSSA